MTDFASVLSAAQQLPEDDRVRLIDALWQSLPPESEAAITDEWAREIECRVAELDSGTAQTVPWSQIRDEALGRVVDRLVSSPLPTRNVVRAIGAAVVEGNSACGIASPFIRLSVARVP